ncbi:hypothetical protein D2V04_13870 [Pelagerythrobacter aerophilus]|uniref:Uncharacterized protein n=1 Tax=Pelagerythrobacter aerophilus TaxID=2306995 RepID=A0A418NDU2_9SPHN|nr:hypothetical protein D2V04_13870 [Pelagerythrobacter aerophilus]
MFSVSDLTSALDTSCKAAGFSPRRSLFEVPGLCDECAQSRDDAKEPLRQMQRPRVRARDPGEIDGESV